MHGGVSAGAPTKENDAKITVERIHPGIPLVASFSRRSQKTTLKRS
jgi:hypothetical protein